MYICLYTCLAPYMSTQLPLWNSFANRVPRVHVSGGWIDAPGYCYGLLYQLRLIYYSLSSDDVAQSFHTDIWTGISLIKRGVGSAYLRQLRARPIGVQRRGSISVDIYAGSLSLARIPQPGSVELSRSLHLRPGQWSLAASEW